MKVRTFLLAAATAATVATSVPALAAGGIETVTVTAERRSENVLQVPASVQAVSIQQLRNIGINNLTDVQLVSPGYSVADSSGYTMIYIRGIGNSNFVGPESNVATYVDDVPRLWGQFANTFVDVKRIEVLKGAQGGLYGRNATGGVVNVITEQPSTDGFYGHGRISYGTHNTFSVGAFVNMPLTDTLAWTIAGERQTHDAYTKNIAIKNPYSAANFPTGSVVGTPQQTADFFNSGVDPHNLDSQDAYAIDTKLAWHPTENLKFTLAGDYYFKDDTSGNQNVSYSPYWTQQFLAANFAAFGINFVPTNPGTCTAANQTGCMEQGVYNKFETATGDRLRQKLKDWGTSLIAVWHTPIADFTSISAYRENHSELDADLCACSLPQGTALVNIRRQMYYEEIRAVSNSDGPFQWLAGATYLGDHQQYDTHVKILPPLYTLHSAKGHDQVNNWTVYAQLGYDITSRLNLTASLRYEHEKNTFTGIVPTIASLNAHVPPPPYPGIPLGPDAGIATESLSKFIPSATLSYKLDDGSIYARWARGVQSGGVNPVASPALFRAVGASLSEGSTFGPEQVDAYEIGYKQALADHRVQVTSAIFYNKFSGIQVSAHATPAYQQQLILAIVNAGSAFTYGAEGSVTWQVIDPLTLGLNVGYLHAEYQAFHYSCGTFLACPSPTLSHSRMLNAPKWQLSMTADLNLPIDSQFDFLAHVVESHTSSQLFSQSVAPGVIPAAEQPGYWLTNLRLGVRTSDGKYEFDVFANNLFNQGYYTYGSVSYGSGQLLGWGNPRIVGAEFKFNF